MNFFLGTHESSRTLDSSVDGLELKACFEKAAASLVNTLSVVAQSKRIPAGLDFD